MSNVSETANETGVAFGKCLLTTYLLRCPSTFTNTLILRSIMVSMISVFAISFNLLFIIAFKRSPTIQCLSNRLLSYLSICDFLMSALGMPIYVARQVMTLYSMHDCILFNIGRLLLVVLSPASFVMLFLISCERFIAVVFPLKYSRWCNEKSVKRWFAIVPLLCVLVLPILMLDIALYHAIIGAIVGIIVVQILSIYAVLYRSARKQRKRIHAMTSGWTSESSGAKKGVSCFGKRKLSVKREAALQSNTAACQETGSNEAEVIFTGSNEAGMKSTESNTEEIESTGNFKAEVEATGSCETEIKSTGSKAEAESTGSNIPEVQIPGETEVKPSKRFQWDVKESFIFTLELGMLDKQEMQNASGKKMEEAGNHAPEVEETGTGTSVDVTRVSEAAENNTTKLKDYKAERTIAIILLFMTLCYLPAIVFVIHAVVNNASIYSWYVYGSWTEVLVMFNCCCNPCIYYWRHREIRRAVINVLPNWFRRTVLLSLHCLQH